LLSDRKYPPVFTVGGGLGNPGDIALGLHQGEEFTINQSARSNDDGLATGFDDVCNPGKMIIVSVSSDNRKDLGGKVYADPTKVIQGCDFATALVST
jgi:hypothetical protein